MVHMDIFEGIRVVEYFEVVLVWNGDPIFFLKNDCLEVSVECFFVICFYLGDDVVHGSGDVLIGLDDKLGILELMMLVVVLINNL